MTTTHRFQGQVRMYSTRAGFAGPKDLPLNFAASFAADGRWTVAPADFGDGGRLVIPDVEVPVFGKSRLVVTLDTTAIGKHEVAGGAVTLTATFKFRILGTSSTLALQLDTGTHELERPPSTVSGAPLDLTNGRLVLAGKASFEGGDLDGDTCLVALDGQLTR